MSTVATAALLAAETEGGGLQVVLPAPAELIWGLVGFALLFVVLWRFAFPALNKMLDERQRGIQGQLEGAESARQEAEKLRRQYSEQLADARSKANEVVEEARADGERLRADIVARAETEAQQILARAREDQQAERGRLIQELRGQVAALSVELAGKIVQKELDPRQHQVLVDQYINELSGLN
ncbi:F0F1 ATP synthase subunit B [soil metagenome]